MEEIDKTLQGLNVNATPFVPGQNVFAKEFVPTIGNPTEPGKNSVFNLKLCGCCKKGTKSKDQHQFYITMQTYTPNAPGLHSDTVFQSRYRELKPGTVLEDNDLSLHSFQDGDFHGGACRVLKISIVLHILKGGLIR